MKTSDTQSLKTRPQTKPVDVPTQDQVIRSISADARIRPEKFVDESTVLFDGE